LTLGGFVYGFTSHDMDPFKRSLGLEDFTREQLIEVVDAEHIPENWDELDEETRLELIGVEEGQAISLEEDEEGDESIVRLAERIPRTIAFTILAFTQMFEVMAIHAGDRVSFFKKGFADNGLLFWAVLSTFFLQLMVVYVPFFQDMFRTAPLSFQELLITAVLGGVVLIGVEIEKYISRHSEDHKDKDEEAVLESATS